MSAELKEFLTSLLGSQGLNNWDFTSIEVHLRPRVAKVQQIFAYDSPMFVCFCFREDRLRSSLTLSYCLQSLSTNCSPSLDWQASLWFENKGHLEALDLSETFVFRENIFLDTFQAALCESAESADTIIRSLLQGHTSFNLQHISWGESHACSPPQRNTGMCCVEAFHSCILNPSAPVRSSTTFSESPDGTLCQHISAIWLSEARVKSILPLRLPY